jgi:hypothetical protein
MRPADLATTRALAAADQHCAAAWIEIALGQSQSLLDAQPGSPHDHDQSAKATAVRRVAGSAHDGDDLFDLRRIGRVTQALIAWSVTGVDSGIVAGDRRRPARSSRSSDMIPPRARGKPDYRRQATRGRPRPDRRAIASDTEQRSRSIRDEYRACLVATAAVLELSPMASLAARRRAYGSDATGSADSGRARFGGSS